MPMSEIKKLEARISNCEKWKSSEIRLSLTDAKLLLSEINALHIGSNPTPVVDTPPPVVDLDGGSF